MRKLLGGLVAAVMSLVVVAATQAQVVIGPDGHPMGVLYRSGVAPAAKALPDTGESQEALSFQGGAVMASSNVHAIFWAPSGTPFPSGYEATIKQYLSDVAATSANHTTATNDWSVVTQYTDGQGHAISDGFTFAGSYDDTTAYPGTKSSNCPGDVRSGPCISDSEMQSEIASDIALKSWTTDSAAAPTDQYLLFTPPTVDSCAGSHDCSTTDFCAYHSAFAGGGGQIVYANLPYIPACDSGQAPSGVSAAATPADADGTLDSAVHELLESATDPLTQGVGWDASSSGDEVADKCTYPDVTAPDTFADSLSGYGTPLGGSFGSDTAFNQLINGHTYYVQTMWSQAAAKTPGTLSVAGCVQRDGPSPSFQTPGGSLHAQHAVSFDGSASYDVQDPLTTYAWNFGDGSAVDTTSGAKPNHVYAASGTYTVQLTVSDATGGANTSTESLPVTVGAAQTGTPTASFSKPSAAGPGQSASFDASASTDPTSTISSYRWTFGDGSGAVTSSTPTTSHAFATVGSYTVSLTVTDLSGQTSSTSSQMTVQTGQPSAAFAAPASITAGQSTTLDASGSSDATSTISSYSWTFGDGSPTATVGTTTVSHTFASAGVYTVSLTVTDLLGATSTTSSQVTVDAPPAPPPTPAPTPPAPTPTPPAPMRLAASVVSTRVSVTRHGVLTVTLSCASGASCVGALGLGVPAALLVSGRRGTTSIAHAAYSLVGGARAGVKLTLTAAALRVLERRHGLAVTATITGAGATTSTVHLTLTITR